MRALCAWTSAFKSRSESPEMRKFILYCVRGDAVEAVVWSHFDTSRCVNSDKGHGNTRSSLLWELDLRLYSFIRSPWLQEAKAADMSLCFLPLHVDGTLVDLQSFFLGCGGVASEKRFIFIVCVCVCGCMWLMNNYTCFVAQGFCEVRTRTASEIVDGSFKQNWTWNIYVYRYIYFFLRYFLLLRVN